MSSDTRKRNTVRRPDRDDGSDRIRVLAELESAAIAAMTYEEAMSVLEEVVEAMEAPGTPLDMGLKLYEAGMALSARCGAILDATEERMLALVETADGVREQPFDPDEDGRTGGRKA